MTNKEKQMPIYRQRVQELNDQLGLALRTDREITEREAEYYQVILQLCIEEAQTGIITLPFSLMLNQDPITNTILVDEIISKNKEYLLED